MKGPKRTKGIGDRRKPPNEHKFKKGQSGNPGGRPKGAVGKATIVKKVLFANIAIVQNGKKQKVTKFEAALTQQMNKALASDTKAFVVITDLAIKHGLIGPETVAETAPLTREDEQVIASLVRRMKAKPEDDK